MRDRVLDVMRRGHAAFNALDAEALRAIVHPEVEWGTAGAFPDMDRVYHGADGVVRWADEVRSAWEWFEVAVEEIVLVEGDRVVLTERVRGQGRGSGIEVDMPSFAVYTIRDGRIARRASHPERAAAIADAAGGA